MRYPLVLILALLGGISFYFNHWIALDGPGMWVWKGTGLGLLAIWAALQARSTDGWLIVAVMALSGLGDVMLETNGLTIGALPFLAGHVVSMILYLRNRERVWWPAVAVAVVVSAIAFSIPADRGAAPGIALYALGLGGMAGTALVSRFPRIVWIGAFLFVASDMMIFSRLSAYGAPYVFDLLIWPLYFGGEALIAWGVVRTLAKERA
jgi:uncharacterized membrane protein YhhN